MNKRETILAVDIGSDSIKIAEFSYIGESVVLQQFAYSESSLYGHDPLTVLAFELHKIASSDEFTARKVHVSISGQSAFVRFVKLPPVGDDPVRVKQIVEFEARNHVPFPMDEVVWDYQLISSEDSSEIDAVFVVVKNEEVDRISEVVRSCGFELSLVEISPTASYNIACASGVSSGECTMLLNIGARCSTLTFLDKGRFFVRTINVAGNTITQQISKEFGIPIADAEEMKRRHGFVALGGAFEEPESEVAATVSKIVRNVMTRLHGEINRSINVYRSQQKGRHPSKLLLSGGSSVMAYTPRFFNEKLKVNVDYFNPFSGIALSDKVDKEKLAEIAHLYADVIGLGLRNHTTCPVEITLLPDSVRKYNDLKRKLPLLYASAFSLLLCLGIVYWGIWHQLKLEKRYVLESKAAIDSTQTFADGIGDISDKVDKIREKCGAVKDVLSKRGRWLQVVSKLQELQPEQMWFTEIRKAGRPGGARKPQSRGLLFNNNATVNRVEDLGDSVNHIVVSGYTFDPGDLDVFDHNLNQEFMQGTRSGDKSVFSGGENRRGARTLDTSLVNLKNLKVQYFKIRIKLNEPI